MVNISSNLTLRNVTVHVIDLVLRLGITRNFGDNIKRFVKEQVVNMASVCCLEPCLVTCVCIYIYIYINTGKNLVCLIMGLVH